MKQIKKTILSFFVLFVFLANFHFLNSNSHILYLKGVIKPDKLSNHDLCSNIYNQFKNILGEERTTFSPKMSTDKNIEMDCSNQDLQQLFTQNESQIQTRERSISGVNQHPRERFQSKKNLIGLWITLSNDIKEEILEKNKSFYLIVFGDGENLIKKAIDKLLKERKDIPLRKIIYLIPPNNSTSDESKNEEDIQNLDDALDKAERKLLSKNKKTSQIPESTSTTRIAVSPQAEDFMNNTETIIINLQPIIQQHYNLLNRWEKIEFQTFLKLRNKYTSNTVKAITMEIIQKMKN